MIAGADGAPKGRWALWTRRGRETPRFSVQSSTAGLCVAVDGAACVAIDLPIGLIDAGWRRIDVDAKRALGRFHSRVFLTPPRPVLACGSYAEANAVCRALTGSGLSKQLWNIVPRILEVDRALAKASSLGVFECHPELVFAGLAGGVVAESKKTGAGRGRRVALLAAAMPGLAVPLADALETTPGSLARPDDIIDAAACLVGAAERETRDPESGRVS